MLIRLTTPDGRIRSRIPSANPRLRADQLLLLRGRHAEKLKWMRVQFPGFATSRKPMKFKEKIRPTVKTHLAMQTLAFDKLEAGRDCQRPVVCFDGLIISLERGQHVAAPGVRFSHVRIQRYSLA